MAHQRDVLQADAAYECEQRLAVACERVPGLVASGRRRFRARCRHRPSLRRGSGAGSTDSAVAVTTDRNNLQAAQRSVLHKPLGAIGNVVRVLFSLLRQVDGIGGDALARIRSSPAPLARAPRRSRPSTRPMGMAVVIGGAAGYTPSAPSSQRIMSTAADLLSSGRARANVVQRSTDRANWRGKTMKRGNTMRNRVAVAGMLGVFALLAAPEVEAQGWGRPTVPRTGACFYRDADFRGEYFCASVGQEFSSVPDGMNDEISSIRTFGGAVVTIFKDKRFGGRTARFEGNVRNLENEGWNDRLSSLRVVNGYGGGGSGYGGGACTRTRIPTASSVAPTKTSSAVRRMRPGCANTAAALSTTAGPRRRFAMRCGTVPSTRERSTMTRPKAEEIVRRAYLSVLGREPDPSSRGYVDKILREKWTEQDVARELRKSDEYRNRPR